MFTLVRLALGARVGGLVAEGGGRVVAVGVGDALDARVVLADRGGGVAVGVGRALEAGAGGLVAHGRGGHAVAAGRALRVRGCACGGGGATDRFDQSTWHHRDLKKIQHKCCTLGYFSQFTFKADSDGEDEDGSGCGGGDHGVYSEDLVQVQTSY